jgi:hypothetical protein
MVSRRIAEAMLPPRFETVGYAAPLSHRTTREQTDETYRKHTEHDG